MARVNCDPKYASYGDGKCLKKTVEDLLKPSGVDLRNGGGLEELQQFQKCLSDYLIVVFDGLSSDRLIFGGNSFRPRNCIYNYVSGSLTSYRYGSSEW